MSESPSATQSFLRLCIMVGTLVVGAMALHVYGPPVPEVNEWVERLSRAADALRSPAAEARPEAAVATDGRDDTSGELSAAPQLIVDPNVRPASAQLVPVERPPAELPPLDAGSAPVESAESTPPETKALTDELKALGAERLRLSAWGAEGEMFRFECSAPMPGGAGFARHFDAIESRPHDAIARVLRDVRQWRDEGAGRLAP